MPAESEKNRACTFCMFPLHLNTPAVSRVIDKGLPDYQEHEPLLGIFTFGNYHWDHLNILYKRDILKTKT